MTPKSVLPVLLVIRTHEQSCEKFESLDMHGPAEGKHGNTLPSCFSSQNVNKHPFVIYLMSHFSPSFLCFLLVILLFKVVPTCCAEGLSSVPQRKEAVVCRMERMC